MRFTITRGSDRNKLVIDDKEQSHTFDMAPMKRHEQDRVREMVVNQWAADNGFPQPYNI